MKMSDWFHKNVEVIGNDKGGLILPLSSWQAKAAAYAINQHDELVAMNAELEGKLANLRQSKDNNESSYIAKILSVNAELVEALERFVRWDEMSLPERIEVGSNGQRDYLRGIAQVTLDKAKELNQ